MFLFDKFWGCGSELVRLGKFSCVLVFCKIRVVVMSKDMKVRILL